MPPAWLQTLAGIRVPLSILAALLVLADIFLLGRRQHMAIMDAVWPLTMLYWGPPGLVFYLWFGRGMPVGHHGMQHGERPMWQATFNGATHCGAGCALWLYPALQPTSWSYWLMMQMAMVLGFATTYPVNWWLIQAGIKEKM